MTTEAGLYMSSHEDCTIYAAHRHPREATQPRTITFDLAARVAFEVVLDWDGTPLVRSASYVVSADNVREAVAPAEIYRDADKAAETDAALADKLYEGADAEWDRVLDAVAEVRDGECAVGDNWSFRWPEPVLDEAVEA